MEKGHDLKLVASEPAAQQHSPSAAGEREKRLRLTWLDLLPFEAATDDDIGGLERVVGESATALAGADSNGARLRLLSRALASARAQESVFTAALADRVRHRDRDGVAILDRVVSSATRRVAELATAHRAECRHAAVTIGPLGVSIFTTEK